MCFIFSVPTVSVCVDVLHLHCSYCVCVDVLRLLCSYCVLMCFVFSVPTVSVLMCFVLSVPTVSVLMCFVFSVLQYLSSYSILSMNLLFFVPTVTVLVHEFALMFFCLDMTYKVDWVPKTNN